MSGDWVEARGDVQLLRRAIFLRAGNYVITKLHVKVRSRLDCLALGGGIRFFRYFTAIYNSAHELMSTQCCRPCKPGWRDVLSSASSFPSAPFLHLFFPVFFPFFLSLSVCHCTIPVWKAWRICKSSVRFAIAGNLWRLSWVSWATTCLTLVFRWSSSAFYGGNGSNISEAGGDFFSRITTARAMDGSWPPSGCMGLSKGLTFAVVGVCFWNVMGFSEQ